MRFAAVLVVAVACSGAFASEPGSAGKDGKEASTASGAESGVRTAADADLIFKEWHSPVTFELDARWLATMEVGKAIAPPGVPSFYCDDVTLEYFRATKLQPKQGIVKLRLDYRVRVRQQNEDKVVALEFTLVSDGVRLPLRRVEGLEVDAGSSEDSWYVHQWEPEAFAKLAHSDLRLIVSMIVRKN